ncbi:MAG: hypothetical protein ACOX9R_06335 [Armatimonadota bacterium]|jgi:hypothetical protein
MAEVAFVAGNGQELLEAFEQELEKLIQSRTHPAEKRIRFGNLRSEISRDNGDVANAAIVYETPGGSTTQINVVYDSGDQTFSYLSDDLDETVTSDDPHEVVQMVERHADSIPEKRMEALKKAIDIWMQEGKSRSEMFSEMNKLLQNEFLGGRITNDELKAGIQHIVKEFSRNGRC